MSFISNFLPTRKKEKVRFRDRIEMYDMLISNMIAGSSILEPSVVLDNSKISIGYSNLASETTLSKYYTIIDFPDFIQPYFIAHLRDTCVQQGVKVNIYMYSAPHKIKWDSAEMRSRMHIWEEFADQTEEKERASSVFRYRNDRESFLLSNRIKMATEYLNHADKDMKRTTMKVSFMIELKCARTDTALMNMVVAIRAFKSMCASEDIKYRELKVNLMDWLIELGLFSLKYIKEVDTRLSKKVVTDDVLAWFNTYRQGRVGDKGILMGIDIHSSLPVLRKFKEDTEAADNWLITAATGGGKSYFLKSLLVWLLADNFIVTVLDYEGDEYTYLADYLAYKQPEDVKVISMGRGSSEYFDPMPIGDLTGDDEIDIDLKQTSMNYTEAMFRTMVYGLKGDLTIDEKKVISLAIRRVYDSVGVTENKATWKRSKSLRLEDVYNELYNMVDSKELVDEASDNARHKAAIKFVNAASVYFEEGEAKYGTFAKPIPVDTLFKARFIDFSFGMKGATSAAMDPAILALKQLSVANVSIQISNYCKYVRHCCNVKVWEEYQRWGALESSGEIILNAITGGRKRGDVNFIVTNDLNSLLNESNSLNRSLVDNIQNYAIGRIRNKKTIEDFCNQYSLQELKPILERLSTTRGKATNMQNKWKHAFCLAMENGKKAVVKVQLPPEVASSKVFKSASIQA